jgi:hypothetical protein
VTYRDTARRFALAEQSTRYGAAPTPHALAAEKLPMSEWGEARRDMLSPRTIAANHASHVSGTAFNLRDALTRAEQEANPMHRLSILADVEDAARALLHAIGEGAEA